MTASFTRLPGDDSWVVRVTDADAKPGDEIKVMTKSGNFIPGKLGEPKATIFEFIKTQKAKVVINSADHRTGAVGGPAIVYEDIPTIQEHRDERYTYEPIEEKK